MQEQENWAWERGTKRATDPWGNSS